MSDKILIITVHCDIDYCEHPEFVEVTLTPAEVDRIGQAVDMFTTDGDLDTIELNIGSMEYFECDDKGNRIDFDGGSEVGSSYDPLWRTEGERIRIRGNRVNVISYDKYNGYIYWSDDISFEKLKSIEGTYKVPN